MELVFTLILLVVAYFVGTAIESGHYRNIEKSENELLYLPAVTSRSIEYVENIHNPHLVYGNVVVSLDYFKLVLAGLKSIVGGRLTSYETLLDRGRREAVIRMKEQARQRSADLILNMRFETSPIYQTTAKDSMGCFEVMAYGTAVNIRK